MRTRAISGVLFVAVFMSMLYFPPVFGDGAYISMVTTASNMGCTNPFSVWTTFINPDRGRLWVGLSFMTRDGEIINIVPQDHSGEWAGTAFFLVYLDRIPTTEGEIITQYWKYAGMQYATALWQGRDSNGNMFGWMDSRGWSTVAGC